MLYTLARRLNFQFSKYRVIPMGSQSKLENIKDQSVHELYVASTAQSVLTSGRRVVARGRGAIALAGAIGSEFTHVCRFVTNEITFGRLFWYRRFDNAMLAFSECLKELGDFAEAEDPQVRAAMSIAIAGGMAQSAVKI